MIRTIARRAVAAWVNYPAFDYVFALIATLLAETGVHIVGWHPVRNLGSDGRYIWIQTLAGLTGALLGLTLTAIAVVFALTRGPRLNSVISRVGFRLIRLLTSGVIGVALSTASFVIVLPLDGSRWLVAALLIAGSFAALRVSRILWVFSQLLHIFVGEAHAEHVSTVT